LLTGAMGMAADRSPSPLTTLGSKRRESRKLCGSAAAMALSFSVDRARGPTRAMATLELLGHGLRQPSRITPARRM
jgi:hypothetical protein